MQSTVDQDMAEIGCFAMEQFCNGIGDLKLQRESDAWNFIWAHRRCEEERGKREFGSSEIVSISWGAHLDEVKDSSGTVVQLE